MTCVQKRKVGRERTIRAPELAVRVHGLAAVRADVFLIEFGAELFLETSEHLLHLDLRALRDESRNRKECLVRVELRPRRERATNDAPLVVLAYLHGDTVENARNTAPAVEDDRFDDVPECFDFLSQKYVFQLRLVPQLRDVQVLVRVRIACDQHPVFSAEVRRVGDEDDGARTVDLFRKRYRIEKFCDRTCCSPGVATKLTLGAFAPNERRPQALRLSFRTPNVRGRLPASDTKVSDDPGSRTFSNH